MKMHRVPDLPRFRPSTPLRFLRFPFSTPTRPSSVPFIRRPPASLRRPSPAPPPALILPPRVGLRRALSTTVRVLSLSLTTLTRGHHRELHPRAIHTAIDRIAGVKQHLHALSVRAASPVAIRAHLVRIHQRRRSCVTTPRARASRAMAAAYRIYHLSTVHLSRASVSPRRRHLSG